MFVYRATIFLGALLLFGIQPLIGKAILPWFGGTTAVWATCLLFFQVVLLAGYAYAHYLVGRLSQRHQPLVHALVVLACLALVGAEAITWQIPLRPDPTWKPPDVERPMLRLLALLAVGVGLPYFVLATTGPLAQGWFRRTHPLRSPYPLYALSNLGSMLALLGYPFFVEPGLTLERQTWVFSGAFALYVVGVLVIARRVSRAPFEVAPAPDSTGALEPPPTWRDHLSWLALATFASAFLVSTTNQIVEDVAAVPFLWVLPLAIYLLTFIIAFGAEGRYSRRWGLPLLVAGSVAAGLAVLKVVDASVPWLIASYALCLFAVAMVCHGELFRGKPVPGHLTAFYLTLSAGGALGGVLIAVVAPLALPLPWEYHIGLVACSGLAVWLAVVGSDSLLTGRWASPVKVGLAVYALALGGALVHDATLDLRGTVEVERNFYGTLRLVESEPGEHARLELYHGRICHGSQYVDESRRRSATTYYSPTSGVGRVLGGHPEGRRGEGLTVGVVGLGVGTLATYGRPGDAYRFYEINPAVCRLALGEGDHFTFLSDSAADIEVVVGDGRLSLERELAAGHPAAFGVLVLDAFSGDAIPVHLLTRQAFEVYLGHLRPGAIIAIHVSNRFLDLVPVATAAARHFGFTEMVVDDERTLDEEASGVFSSTWILLSTRSGFLAWPSLVGIRQIDSATIAPIRLWTDSYSNILQILGR